MAVALLHSSVGFFSALDTRFIERQGGVAAHPLLSTQFFQAAFSVSQSAPPSQLLYMLLMESWTPAGQVVVLSRARERATTPLSRPQVSPAPLYASSLELILGGHASRTAS